MEISWMIAAIGGIVVAGAVLLPLYLSAARRAAHGWQGKDELISRAAAAETAQDMLERAKREALEAKLRAEEARDAALSAKSAAEQRAQMAEQKAAAEIERATALADARASQALSRAEEKLAEAERRIADWKANEETHLRHSQAAIQKVGADLSSKLLEDHKRENEANRKATEEITEAKTKNFFEQLNQLQSTIAVQQHMISDAAKTSQTIMKALSNPGSAGQLAELGLSNMLRELGLEEGRDYELQVSIASIEGEGTIRPDFLIYLPNDVICVIDSKASSHLVKMGNYDPGSVEEIEGRNQLRQRMETELRNLANKAYLKKVHQHFRQQKGRSASNQTLLVMHLPAETMLQHLTAIDNSFIANARKENILVTTPSSLQNLLMVISQAIKIEKQNETHAAALQQVETMLEGAATALKHVAGINAGLKKAADSMSKFNVSMNRYFLSRARRLQKYGLAVPQELSKNLSGIEVLTVDNLETIEGETNIQDIETVSETSPILRVAKA